MTPHCQGLPSASCFAHFWCSKSFLECLCRFSKLEAIYYLLTFEKIIGRIYSSFFSGIRFIRSLPKNSKLTFHMSCFTEQFVRSQKFKAHHIFNFIHHISVPETSSNLHQKNLIVRTANQMFDLPPKITVTNHIQQNGTPAGNLGHWGNSDLLIIL